MADNRFIAAPAQVTIGTNYTHNTTGTPSKNNFDKEECGDIVDYQGDDDQYKGGYIVDNISTLAPAKINIVDKHTQNTMDKPFHNNCDQ